MTESAGELWSRGGAPRAHSSTVVAKSRNEGKIPVDKHDSVAAATVAATTARVHHKSRGRAGRAAGQVAVHRAYFLKS